MLVIGGGPAGLEVARVLGRRGAWVMLAEAGRSLGGRVDKESRLPGLSEWRRVADWRLIQIGKLDKVELFSGSPMSASGALEVEADHIIIRGDEAGALIAIAFLAGSEEWDIVFRPRCPPERTGAAACASVAAKRGNGGTICSPCPVRIPAFRRQV